MTSVVNSSWDVFFDKFADSLMARKDEFDPTNNKLVSAGIDF